MLFYIVQKCCFMVNHGQLFFFLVRKAMLSKNWRENEKRERLKEKMKQYIEKDACYVVKVSSRIWQVMRDCCEEQEMREMDGEILEAKVEETRVHALKHETLALVSLYSVHLWQWQRDREGLNVLRNIFTDSQTRDLQIKLELNPSRSLVLLLSVSRPT